MTSSIPPLALAVLVLLGASSPVAQGTAAPQAPAPPPPTQKPATEKPATQKPRPQQPRSAAANLTLTVEATDMSGNGVGAVEVHANGPVDRSGTTGNDGAIVFRGMRAGTYRLRFDRQGFVTLEREVAIRAGQPASVSVALTAAPVKPEPEPPAAPEPSAPAPARTARAVEPRFLSIPDFVDKNFIGSGEPQKSTLLGCAEGGTARVLQIREPLNNQQHDDTDEIVYVVAGSGIVRIRNQDIRAPFGHFVLIPRGMPHSIRRDGRNPVVVLSVLAGAPCLEDDAPVK